MRVFARYFSDGDFRYRRTTLLQFGDSWELIGSIVLINPGSATPISNQPLDSEKIKEISCFLGVNCENDWFEFKPDPTMNWVMNIFDDYYIASQARKKLNGVVQLFNLFNLRDQKLETALNSIQHAQSEHLFSTDEDIELFRDKPVYLGWGATGKSKHQPNSILREKANYIFSKSMANNQYLESSFDDNTFYHPRYINMQYGRPHVHALLQNFSGNTLEHQAIEFEGRQLIRRNRISNQQLGKVIDFIAEKESLLTRKHRTIRISERKKNTIRFVFEGIEPDCLEFTITSTKPGFLGIRGIRPEKGMPWNDNLAHKAKYESILQELNFTTGKTWLGVKEFSSFNFDFDETADESISKIANCFLSQLDDFIENMLGSKE